MEIQCPDCLAHYPEQYDKHDCPPWLKELVRRNKSSTLGDTPTLNLRETWDRYLAPRTTLSFEEAIAILHPSIEETPHETLGRLKILVVHHPK